MRRPVLDILRCPKCKGSSFFLEGETEGRLEIESGVVICKDCGLSYTIKDGILDILTNPSLAVIQEREAMDDEEYIKDEAGNGYKVTDETIERFKDKFLSLPEGDGSYFFKKGGSFQTIKDASSRFYSTFDALNLTGKEKVLEIGSCFSWASYKFAERGCKVTAIDISNYLKAARVYLEKAYFDRMFADMHDLPFADNTFDLVFSSAALHHTKNLKAVFSEIHRVLKKGGRIVLINESGRGIFEKVHPGFKELEKRGFGDTSYSISQWRKGARSAGFKDIKIDFLSIVDDYITRHENRVSGATVKLRLAYFIRRHRILESFLLFLLVMPRIFFRPKSWRMICTRHKECVQDG